jgi:hypothetical protein
VEFSVERQAKDMQHKKAVPEIFLNRFYYLNGAEGWNCKTN